MVGRRTYGFISSLLGGALFLAEMGGPTYRLATRLYGAVSGSADVEGTCEIVDIDRRYTLRELEQRCGLPATAADLRRCLDTVAIEEGVEGRVLIVPEFSAKKDGE